MCSLHQGSTSVNSGSRQLFDVVGFDHLGQPQMTVGENLPLQAAISRSLGFNARPGRFIAAVVPSASVDGPAGPLDASEPRENVFDRFAREAAEAEASNSPVDAFGQDDDSDATEGAEDAGESNLADGSQDESRQPLPERNRRVIVMRGNGELDIVSGLLTDDEACAEAEKFDNIQEVYTARDWDAAETFSVKDARARFVQSAVRSQLSVIARALPYVTDSGDIGLLAMSLREVAKLVDGIRDNGSIDEVPDNWGFDYAMGPEGWDNDDLKAALGLESEVPA